MATTVRPLHSRNTSITRLECDVIPDFTFPVQPRARSQSLLPGAHPASQSPAPPPRRGSVPLNNVPGLAVDTSRPRSRSNSPISPDVTATGPLSSVSPSEVDTRRLQTSYHNPGGINPAARALVVSSTPTILNNVSLNPGTTAAPLSEPTKVHRRGLSDLLSPTMLEPKREDMVLPAVAEKAAPTRPAPPPPGGTRRGHAHRRSGAISSGDVWSILSQSAPNLALGCTGGNGGQATDASPQVISSAGSSPVLSWSAPVSPGFNGSIFLSRWSHTCLVPDALPGPSSLPSPTSPLMDYDSATAADRRNRVQFIERVEIIPRPLSAGTETSSITVRGHSGTDSINSISSVLPSRVTSSVIEPAPTCRRGRTRSNSQTLLQPTSALRATSDRPSTAGAVLLTPPLAGGAATEVTISSIKRPATALPSSSSALRSANGLPTKQLPPPSKKMHKKALSDYSVRSSSEARDLSSNSRVDSDVPSATAEPSEPSCKMQKKKKSKKQIKNWAGTILGKGRGLRHSSKRQLRALPRRSPTPPLPRPERRPGDNEWVSAAWNESYVLMPVDDSQGPNSSSENTVLDIATGSPIIDLDAALGPYKNPIGPNAGFAAARRRRMHSAVGLKGNGYFHRRSESMPEMQLFSLSEHEDDFHMADVFEEDEEEDADEEESEESEDDEEEVKIDSGEGLGIGIKVVDGEGASWQEDLEMEWGSDDVGAGVVVSRRGSSGEREVAWRSDVNFLTPGASLNPRSSTTSISSIAPETAIEPPTPCVNRKGAPPAITILTPAQSSSSLTSPQVASTATIQHQQAYYPQSLDSPATFVTAASNPNTPLQLDFPTEYADSASSFDPYLNLLGEPGPEVRMGVDDVPSLTSSSSTMTIGGTYTAMPPTPGTGVANLPGKEGRERKEGKSKRWSKVWSFWKLR